MASVFIPTGSLRLDIALGTGGLPAGEIILITGRESCGKSALCLHILAEAQKNGGLCAYIDSDHSLTPDFAYSCGVNPDLTYIVEPNDAEQAIDTLEILASSGAMSVIALDSVTALVPQAEIKMDIENGEILTSDRLLSQSLHTLRRLIQKTKTTLLFTDQPLTSLSAVYHNLATNLSRQALKLSAAIHLNLQRCENIGEGISDDEKIPLEVRIIKNKHCPGFRTLKLELFCKNGMINYNEILDLGLQLRIIRRNEDIYRFGGTTLGANYQEVVRALEQNPQVKEQIEQLVRKRLLTTAE